MYHFLRPLIFRLPPETAHGITIALLRFVGAVPPLRAAVRATFAPNPASRPVHAFGLSFPNAVGLAAGYDKDGLAWRGLAALPFGHLELGTVTPRPQGGNPRPRIFRLVEDEAVVNRMGFPGLGAEALVQRLRGRPSTAPLRGSAQDASTAPVRGSAQDAAILRVALTAPVPDVRGAPVVGVNIGKNKDTPLEAAAEDYAALVRIFAPLADYLAVNVSSPNTPGLRNLQEGGALEELLGVVAAERREAVQRLDRPVPVLVKLAPDLDEGALERALGALCEAGMDGVILSNTTLSRDGLQSPHGREVGGLSGRPLTARNTALVRQAARLLQGRLPIVASGGIMNSADALEKLDAGATLVQLYTGMIYVGPGLVPSVVSALAG